MGNPFEEFEVVAPDQNPDAPTYVPPNPFAEFEESKPMLTQYNAFAPDMAGDSLLRNTGEPFNRGVIGLLEFPVALTNAAVAGGYALAGKSGAPQMRYPLSEMASKAGIIAPEEDRKTGVIPRFSEFTGAGMVPAGAILNYGRLALADLSPVPSALKQMGMATAKAPGTATAFDIASNFTAAAGGEVARTFTDNETIIAMAELGSGFVPTATMLLPAVVSKVSPTAKVSRWMLETLAPFTEAGARAGASRRLQDVAADPKATAAALDVNSPVPPMQQSGDPGILKLQNMILKKFPKLRAQFSKELDLAIKEMSRQADFPGGDVERATHILNIRQQQAVEEAALAVQNLGPSATPRQISVAARRAAKGALDDAVSLERALWEGLDTAAPADIENAAVKMSELLASASPDADPNDIPGWLLNKMSKAPIDKKLLSQLEKGGLVAKDGTIDPAVLSALERQGVLKTRQRTLEDVKTLRSRVLQEMREEKAAPAPNRNKLRILGEMQSALLEDMGATGVDGVEKTLAFSRAVNERFRQGRVGRLLGFDATGAERVAAEDFLQNIVYGPASATTTKAFVEMANEAPDLTLDFIRSQYLKSVVGNDGKVSQTAHKAFITAMKKKDLFEIFPELESELGLVAKSGAEAMRLQVPDAQINTTRLNQAQSRAALLLQANPGEEMSLVLKSKNPAGAIQDLMKVKAPGGRILASDAMAVQGLKESFKEEVFNLASKEIGGQMVPQGAKLKVMFDEYRPVMRALHMNDTEMRRLQNIAEQIRLAQLSGGEVDIGTTVLNNALAKPIELIARILSARTGAKLGQGTGGGQLVIAGYMSRQSQEALMSLTSSKAEKLLIAATSDAELYRSLLVGPRSTNAAKDRAAKVLEAQIRRLEGAGVTTLGIGSAQEDEQ